MLPPVETTDALINGGTANGGNAFGEPNEMQA
jgi:hypothetical protein